MDNTIFKLISASCFAGVLMSNSAFATDAKNLTSDSLTEISISSPSLTEFVAVVTNEMFSNDKDSSYKVKIFDAHSFVGEFVSNRTKRPEATLGERIFGANGKLVANTENASTSIQVLNEAALNNAHNYQEGTSEKKHHFLMQTNRMIIQLAPQLSLKEITNLFQKNNWNTVNIMPEKNVAIVEGEFGGNISDSNLFPKTYDGSPGRELQSVYDAYANHLNQAALDLEKLPQILYAAPDFEISSKTVIDLSNSLALVGETNDISSKTDNWWKIDSWWKDDLIARMRYHGNEYNGVYLMVDSDMENISLPLNYKIEEPEILSPKGSTIEIPNSPNGTVQYIERQGPSTEFIEIKDCEDLGNCTKQ